MRAPTRWEWLTAWLDGVRYDLGIWLLGFGDDWTPYPVHKDNQPGVWVPMSAPEYQLLIPHGYPYPEGQEIDWEAELAANGDDDA